jgi:hypothetical protein
MPFTNDLPAPTSAPTESWQREPTPPVADPYNEDPYFPDPYAKF